MSRSQHPRQIDAVMLIVCAVIALCLGMLGYRFVLSAKQVILMDLTVAPQSACVSGDLDMMSWYSNVTGHDQYLVTVESILPRGKSQTLLGRTVSLQQLRQGEHWRASFRPLTRDAEIALMICSDTSKTSSCLNKTGADMHQLSINMQVWQHPELLSLYKTGMTGAFLGDADKDHVFFYQPLSQDQRKGYQRKFKLDRIGSRPLDFVKSRDGSAVRVRVKLPQFMKEAQC